MDPIPSCSGRARSKGNWQIAERNALVELVAERKDMILSRKTDWKANTEKSQGWSDVTAKFHARFGEKWSTQQIKEQWKRMRIAAKKEYSKYNKEARRTGGGPPPPDPSHLTIIIKELCPYDFSQLYNIYDDDAGQYFNEGNDSATSSLLTMATGTTPETSENPYAGVGIEVESDPDVTPETESDRPTPTSTPRNALHIFPGSLQGPSTEYRTNSTNSILSEVSRKRSQTDGPSSTSLPSSSNTTNLPSAKRNLNYSSQGKKTRLSEERVLELAEAEHAVRIEVQWKEHDMRLKEHELRMDVLNKEREVAEAKLLESQGYTNQ
nr:myb/SANT-like DNA-binding domain-containing protein 3 [Lytechinus pictus]